MRGFQGCLVAPRGGMHGCCGGDGCSGACMVAPGGHAWLLLGGVCGCSRGACVVALEGACIVAAGGCVWLLQGGMCGCCGGSMHSCCWGGMCGCSRRACMFALGGGACVVVWDMMRYRDTINEQTVRILLECILVGL